MQIDRSDADESRGVLVLDGPSAVAFYRDRDDLAATSEEESEPDQSQVELDRGSEDFWLSDEDVAAMLAVESVFGHKSFVGEGSDESVGHSLPPLRRSTMNRMRLATSRSRDLKQVSYEELGIRPPAKDSTLYLLLPEPERRRIVKHVRRRICRVELPPYSFLRLGDDAYVPTPELTFLLMAHYLDVHELIALGMELCGHYRLVGASTDNVLASNRTLYGQNPLTTPRRIAALLDHAEGFHGLKLARRAFSYLVAGSASPMETALYMLLCLPRNLGGYGLPRPVLNVRRRVTVLAGSFTLSRTLVPDLFWPAAMLDVEYDSEEFHASTECLLKGARRTLALRSMNVEVISVTKDVVHDEDSFDGLVRLIAKALGVRLRRPTQAGELQRAILRQTVLS